MSVFTILIWAKMLLMKAPGNSSCDFSIHALPAAIFTFTLIFIYSVIPAVILLIIFCRAILFLITLLACVLSLNTLDAV